MAWIIEDRKCPSCKTSHRVLVIQARGGGFRLSCSWCAFLSERLDARAAFFEEWTDKVYPMGHVLNLSGVMHWRNGKMVENVPIRAVYNKNSALVTVQKEKDSE